MDTIIKNELLENENVLWQGQSNGRLFSAADILLIPFSLMWGGFAIFWEASALSIEAPLLLKLWGIPFVFVGVYMIIGRFFYKNFLNKNTHYYVTNKKVVIIKNTLKMKTNTLYLNTLPEIEKSIRASGSGTIKFGSSGIFSGLYANSGMDFFAYGYRFKRIPPAFYDIDNAEKVYKLICEAKTNSVQ